MFSNFRSCFIVDVQIEKDVIRLMDSGRCRYLIDKTDHDVVAQFKKWFSGVFLAAKSQTLTVFAWENRGQDPDFELYIIKFFNIGDTTNRNAV